MVVVETIFMGVLFVSEKIYDLIIVGGGVNGCGIAADAAGRGLSIALFEANDLASATSSASSKLLHGGLRYLEHYEFGLVKKALTEREIILNMAPHVVSPLRFRLPHRPYLRPAWMIRAGLFLYDHLAKRTKLLGSKSITFNQDSPLKSIIRKGFEYSDGWMDDSRIVVLNACLAHNHGASIYPQMKVIQAKRKNKLWHVTVQDQLTDNEHVYVSRGLVNASGPWVAKFFDCIPKEITPRNIRLVKGSHIIVPKLHNDPEAYILQNEDKRIVFVIPYLKEFSLIGTTDVDYHHNPRNVCIDDEEKRYLINVVNQHFKQHITEQDIIATYSGVRPLSEENDTSAQKASRDYTLILSDNDGHAPLLSVFGGKLTTYRELSQAVMNRLKPYFPSARGDWTANALLPGGDIKGKNEYIQYLQAQYPWLTNSLSERLATTYGSNSTNILNHATAFEQLGEHYGAEFTESELDYLIENEWVLSLDDAIKRRTKIYLFLNQTQKEHLSTVIEHKVEAYCRKKRTP